MNKVPTGKLARTGVAGLTAARAGAKKLKLYGKKPFLSKEAYAQEKDKTHTAMAEQVFQGLSKLRGTALKIAQIMSLEIEILPDAWRRELSKSHYQAPPLNRAVIRKLVKTQLGSNPEVMFQTFDGEAFAAASLGQVHRAVTPDGRQVAVKVQYPGIADAVDSDMKLVKQALKPILRSEFFPRAMAEINRRLKEELDYRVEFDATAWFHSQCAFPGVVFPEPLAQWSTERVLTTQFLEGKHLDAWLETGPDQETINRMAQRLYDFTMYSAFQQRKFHADPNPGNFLFRDDGTLGVVDFGCVKSYTPQFSQNLAALMRAHIQGNREARMASFKTLGFDVEDPEFESFYQEMLVPFGEWMARPFRAESFDFAANPDHIPQGAALMHNSGQSKQFKGFTSETIFLDRTLYGVCRIFSKMGATVRFGQEWLRPDGG